MSAAAQNTRYSILDYLTRERSALEKHEYRDGEILLMAGGTVSHSLTIANVNRALGNLLTGKPCNVFDSNLRVRVPRGILYTYPDVTVICGKPQIDPNDPFLETVTNPTVIVEVLSPSTEGYDRGEKFNRFRKLDSLDEYVLVSLTTPRVENFGRQPSEPAESNDGASHERIWLFTSIAGLAAHVKFRSLDIAVPLAEIYRGIEFPPPIPEETQRP